MSQVHLPRRWLSVAGVLAFAPLTLAFAMVAAYWTEVPLWSVWQAVPVLGVLITADGGRVLGLYDGLILVGAVPLLALHELVHGAVARLLGGTPYFGVRWLAAYTGIRTGYFTRWQYAAFIAAPFALFTVLGLGAILLEVPWIGAAVFYLGLHTAGCVGDLWMLAQVVPLRNRARIADRPYGCEVFGDW